MWTIPGVGTTYVYQLTAPGDTAVENDTIVVTANGQHVGGKSNVIRIATFVAGQAQQGGFYAIESNGDISLGDYLTSFPDSITWATYPTGSHKTKTTSVDSFSFSEHIVRSDVLSFIGNERTSTAAGNYSTIHIREVNLQVTADTSSFDPFVDSSSTTQDYWFAPSIGLFAKETEAQTFNGQNDPSVEFDLIKYVPR